MVQGSVGISLLIVLAICLCGLCAYQWWREYHLREQIEAGNRTIQSLQEDKAGAEQLSERYREEVRRIEIDRGELQEIVRTNAAEVSRLKAELSQLTLDSEQSLTRVDVFKDALEKANQAIQQQNEGVRKMNEEFKRLAEERNVAVEKFNELAREYDALAQQYNEAVERYNTLVQTGRR